MKIRDIYPVVTTVNWVIDIFLRKDNELFYLLYHKVPVSALIFLRGHRLAKAWGNVRSICFCFLQYRVVKFVCLFLLVSLDLYDIPSVDEVFKNIRKPTTTIFSWGVILHGVRWSANQTCLKKDILHYKESIVLNSTSLQCLSPSSRSLFHRKHYVKLVYQINLVPWVLSIHL